MAYCLHKMDSCSTLNLVICSWSGQGYYVPRDNMHVCPCNVGHSGITINTTVGQDYFFVILEVKLQYKIKYFIPEITLGRCGMQHSQHMLQLQQSTLVL